MRRSLFTTVLFCTLMFPSDAAGAQTSMRRMRAVLALTAATAASFLLFTGAAGAQSVSCASFATQQQAQAYYDQHKNDVPGNVDPAHLDADGDGKACEGLPSAAPAATAAPASAPLPNNGAETGVMALSGLSLLEAGYGMTLLARRYGVKRRNVPLYLLRKLVSAGKAGQATVALGDDIYLIHGSALTATVDDYYDYVDLGTEEQLEFVPENDDEDDEVIFAPPPLPTPHVSLYAALAKGAGMSDEPPVPLNLSIENDVDPEPELSDDADDFAWRI